MKVLQSWTLVLVMLAGVAAPASALDVGARMPPIRMQDLAGKPIDAKGLAGKVVLVDFWATWCAPCKEELPVLQRLHEKYAKQGLVIVGVSVDRDADKARAFVKKLGLTFRVVHDGKHGIASKYEPPKMPSSYLIDRAGIVRHVHGGFRASDAADLEARVKKLLGSK